MANTDGTGLEPLTTIPSNYLLVDWSPKGTEIIFTANISQNRVANYGVETFVLTLADKATLQAVDISEDVDILWKD